MKVIMKSILGLFAFVALFSCNSEVSKNLEASQTPEISEMIEMLNNDIYQDSVYAAQLEAKRDSMNRELQATIAAEEAKLKAELDRLNAELLSLLHEKKQKEAEYLEKTNAARDSIIAANNAYIASLNETLNQQIEVIERDKAEWFWIADTMDSLPFVVPMKRPELPGQRAIISEEFFNTHYHTDSLVFNPVWNIYIDAYPSISFGNGFVMDSMLYTTQHCVDSIKGMDSIYYAPITDSIESVFVYDTTVMDCRDDELVYDLVLVGFDLDDDTEQSVPYEFRGITAYRKGEFYYIKLESQILGGIGGFSGSPLCIQYHDTYYPIAILQQSHKGRPGVIRCKAITPRK